MIGTRMPTRNRVAVYYSNRDIRVETRTVPTIGPGELLMRVCASGVCGSDVMEWYRRPKAPVVLGHEVAGQVVALGAGVERVEVGDRIVATHHVPCMVCHYCLSGRETVCNMLRRTSFDPGGFAEYIRLPRANVERGVLKLPAHVPDDAACMVEPLGCVVRSQHKARFEPGNRTLIVGSGVSGCLHLVAAKAQGAGEIFDSDVRSERLDTAKRLGADVVLDARDDVAGQILGELGRGVDRVIVCTGASNAIAQALASVDRGGTILFFAPMGPDESFPLPFNQVFWRNDVTLTSSYGAGLRDLGLGLSLISSGRVDVRQLITHCLPLDRLQEAFELMMRGEESLKIVIDPRLDAAAPPVESGRNTATASHGAE